VDRFPAILKRSIPSSTRSFPKFFETIATSISLSGSHITLRVRPVKNDMINSYSFLFQCFNKFSDNFIALLLSIFYMVFTPAAEGHGLCLWMNAPAFSRDVAPLGVK